MNTKLTFKHNQWIALLTVLRLYIGKYPDAYKGAKFFKTEAESLIERIEAGIISPFDPTEGIEINSPEEVMAIVRALEIYNGRYQEAYGGAKDFRDETEKIYPNFINNFHDEIKHLLYTNDKGGGHE